MPMAAPSGHPPPPPPSRLVDGRREKGGIDSGRKNREKARPREIGDDVRRRRRRR